MSASSPRRGVWRALGAMCIVGGLVAAALLWNGASQRRDSAIENLARAPIGCDTTLDFIEPGEYLLFVETSGILDGVRGDCGVEGAYDIAGQGALDVEITLVDPDGADVDLDRSFGAVAYDAAGFSGTARFSIDIVTTDDHVLRAESESDGVFVVAVGRDPSEGVAALRVGAIVAGVAGLLLGLAFVLLGARKSSATVPAGPWTPGVAPQPGAFVPGGSPPQGPPVYGQQGGPPQWGQQHPPQHPPSQQPPAPYGQQQPPPPPQRFAPQPPPPRQQPPAPQFQPPAVQPDIPGQPTLPPPPSSSPSEMTAPDTAFRSQPRDEPPTQERPPPPDER